MNEKNDETNMNTKTDGEASFKESTKETAQNSSEYSFYTEKIVKNPWNRVKKMCKYFAKVLGAAVVFGVVFGTIFCLVMLFFYPRIKDMVGEEETSRNIVIIPTDSQLESYTDASDEQSSKSGEETSAAILESIPETSAATELDDSLYKNNSPLGIYVGQRIEEAFASYRPGIKEFDSVNDSLNSLVYEAKKSTVSVMVGKDRANATALSESEAFMGIIVAEDGDYYYILTDGNRINADDHIYVTYNDYTLSEAEFIARDVTTGFAVIFSSKENFETETSELVKPITLGNSYIIQQGDTLMAMGNIYGYTNSVVYTNAISVTNYLEDTDSNYRIIATDMAASDTDFGILMNVNCELAGLIVTSSEKNNKTICAYGISELKALIGRLVNGIATPYLGVRGQSVTTAMSDVYGIPKGVYIDQVEMNSPAYNAGVQSGDVICFVDGVATNNIKDLQGLIFSAKPGDELTFSILRPGKEEYRDIELKITLGVE